MNILLHVMILYYILYTYKTKYTCLFLRPVNILAVLSVLMEVFSIMRFKFCKILMVMNYLQNCQELLFEEICNF